MFPKTVSALRKVPGIGDYTAGAIASITFKEVGACVSFHVSHKRRVFFHFIISNFTFQVVPVVDGTVVRVVARLKAISANPKESVTIKNFWCVL